MMHAWIINILGVRWCAKWVQASASSPVASKSAAGTVKHGDIPGRAMKVRDNAPAKAQANGSSSAQDTSPQFKRQKLQSSP